MKQTQIPKKYEKIYQDLKQKYTDEEIVDAFLIPEDLTEKEQQKMQEEFAKFRMELLQNRSEEDKLLAALLGFKYKIKAYVKQKKFDKNKTSAHFLKEYLDITNRKTSEFAEEINIQTTKITLLLEGKEKLDKALSFRLERHSGDTIPALYWWKLVEKEIEYEISTETELRKFERLQVKRVAYRA